MSVHVHSSKSRIRIKGRWPSVLRFFCISVGFMMTWVLVSSQLGYYAKMFGPQILLQLNFAFYLPSIPVLIISGQLEKCLDTQFGPISSMMIRLNTGLAGSAAICAAFPFIAGSHSSLLWIVALLGTLSAIAFSTSYQLVQWFRHADIIGLGIGAVGSGPMVLLIQLALTHVQAFPVRWQWIAQFEITAALVLLGLCCSLSLFGQYWDILTGAQPYEEQRQPLLGAEAEAADGGEAGGGPGLGPGRGHGQPQRSRSWYGRVEVTDAEEQEQEHQITLRFTPAGNVLLAPDPFQGGMPVVFREPSDILRGFSGDAPPPVLEVQSRSSKTLSFAEEGWTGPPLQDRLPAPFPDGGKQPLLTAPLAGREAGGADAGGAGSSPFAGDASQHEGWEGPGAAAAPRVDSRGGEGAGAAGPGLTLMEETWVTLSYIWPVLLSFFTSVTLMYLIFPFFTYIPSSDLLGDLLPRVLFFTRIGADTIGRFSPRIKSLLTHSPSTLFALATAEATVAALLLLYIKAPEAWRHDLLPVGAVVFLWTAAGYVNTCANMLAPAMVPDHLCPRASALMALIFQIAHFAGLVFAAVLIYLMFGDIAGR